MPVTPKKRGRPFRPIIEFPVPLTSDWVDPPTFPAALALHMHRHGDTTGHLHRAIVQEGEKFDRKTLMSWASGTRLPNAAVSFLILARIERRYRLPEAYFRKKLPISGKAVTRPLLGITPAERRRLAWHLPNDFDMRPSNEKAEIIEWVRSVIITGTTDYRRFQAEALKIRYGLRFPSLDVPPPPIEDEVDMAVPAHDPTGNPKAPARLVREMFELIRFKTATLTAIGEQRSGVWGEETASQKVEHLALMFGALAAASSGPVQGLDVPLQNLSLALLAFPAVWDWYLRWREGRRGFYTAWELDMLSFGTSLARKDTGWLRQHPQLAERLMPIPGLLSEEDISRARSDWESACDEVHAHGLARSKQIGRVVRVHRDPFEPILPVLESDSPVGQYRRITTEILSRMPDQDRYPRAAAEAVRGFLMLRLGLHLGVRQKNLRQLLMCPRGGTPRSERQLESMRCGELRWSQRDAGWEVLIPAVAFKNATSSFFGKKPFRLLLPDLDQLYELIEAYISTHRSTLLNGAEDPGTFFVKTVKRTSSDAAYNQTSFYEAWRLVIQRYGIFNPYTGLGAIKGLLPHGPHNVRDVLATHILKQTGSYEQASYAIQDTPEMLSQHYGRFLPQDKASLAADILNRAWAA